MSWSLESQLGLVELAVLARAMGGVYGTMNIQMWTTRCVEPIMLSGIFHSEEEEVKTDMTYNLMQILLPKSRRLIWLPLLAAHDFITPTWALAKWNSRLHAIDKACWLLPSSKVLKRTQSHRADLARCQPLQVDSRLPGHRQGALQRQARLLAYTASVRQAKATNRLLFFSARHAAADDQSCAVLGAGGGQSV